MQDFYLRQGIWLSQVSVILQPARDWRRCGLGCKAGGAWLRGGTLNALAYVSSTHLQTVPLTSRVVITPCVCVPPVTLAVYIEVADKIDM